MQNLKDEGINVNINSDQINELVNNIFKGISKKDSDLNLNNFLKKYENEKRKTFHKFSDTRYDIDNYEMNDAIENYNNEGTKNNLLREYNSFIDKFNLSKKKSREKRKI